MDIRSKSEYDEDGKIPNSVLIPLIDTTRKWNLETMERIVTQTPNADFLKMVQKAFPDKDTPLLISCSDGRGRAIQALMLLDEEGYTNIVGMKGGFNEWFEIFDNKLQRRGTSVKYTTVYQADGDAMGVHSTGAGFTSVDQMDISLAKLDRTEWVDWAEEMGKS